MRDHGHPDAAEYPVAMVWEEAALVVERQNGEMVNLAVIIQAATSTTGMTASKESVKKFENFIKGLSGE